MDKYILGLCTMGNSSAALFKNDVLIAAIEEERLTRKKNDGRFPYNSIKEVLSICKINITDVDEVCIYWKPWNFKWRVYATLKKALTNPNHSIDLFKKASKVFLNVKSSDEENGKWRDLFNIKKKLNKYIGNFSGKISYVDHHLSHQMYAEIMQDWSEFISLSYDGGGETHSTVLCMVKNGNRKVLSCHKWPNSLGHFYSTFTGFLGFKMLEGEYKMMGLAPYGKPKYKQLILDKILTLKSNGKYELNTKICDYHAALNGKFSSKMIELFGFPRKKNDEFSKLHTDLATSVQEAFEEALVHILKPALKSYPLIKKLVISGGCALNVTANGKLISNGIFKEVIIPPAPHDAGCCIGACIPSLKKINIESIRSPYKGRIFTNDQIELALKKFGLVSFKRLNTKELILNTATSLANNNIIAWFQGGAEFGPRALGNRSYLANPRNSEIRNEINKKIKKRELFRPFAPSVLLESSKEFFATTQASPYMNIVSEVLSPILPAITHIDNTARVHTVSVKSNPLYHKLIKAFQKISGVPVLLNTSFNIQEPIVYSPEDAIKTFLESAVDVLVIGNYFIERSRI